MFDLKVLETEVQERGYYRSGRVLDDDACDALVAMYADDRCFRKQVVMERHHFGRGEYKYLSYPLPLLVESLRASAYEDLAPVANRWSERLGSDVRYPATLAEFLARCALAGQTRPTPLMLKYGAGDYNCLHQDLYGEMAFPLQMVVMLSEPGRDYEGGEFVVVEQRPRMQSKASVISARRGEAIVFSNNERPAAGTRGFFRVKMRHGVSEVTRGERYALGLIFHDAA